MNNDERMRAGLLYNPGESALMARQTEALELLYDFNATRPSQGARRSELLAQMFAEVGEGCYIEPPLHANWGGKHVHLGRSVYANFGLTLVDDGEIHIGDHVMFGPNVTITTGGHPVEPELRRAGAQFNLPVRIGAGVWVGAGVQIMPGVSIGEKLGHRGRQRGDPGHPGRRRRGRGSLPHRAGDRRARPPLLLARPGDRHHPEGPHLRRPRSRMYQKRSGGLSQV